MRHLLLATGLATAICALPLTGTASQAAALAPMPNTIELPAEIGDVTNVHYRSYRHRHGRRYGPRHRGYRGYRNRRPGYRRHNGWWYPPAAFIAGAIINEAVRASRGSSRHHNWCDNKYRSYRRSDGTFQPYGNRPRKRCNSPYDGR